MKIKDELRKHGDLELYARMDLKNLVPVGTECPACVDNPLSMVEDCGNPSWLSRFFGLKDDRGVGVVEIILILVVLIALVTVFRDELSSLVDTILSKITANANAV